MKNQRIRLLIIFLVLFFSLLSSFDITEREEILEDPIKIYIKDGRIIVNREFMKLDMLIRDGIIKSVENESNSTSRY